MEKVAGQSRLLALFQWFRNSRPTLSLCFFLLGCSHLAVDGQSWPQVISCCAVVLVLLLLYESPPGRRLTLLGLCCYGWIIVFSAFELCLPPRFHQSRIERATAPMLQQLSAYHATHGRYPQTLAEGGVEPMVYRLGPVHYGFRGGKRAQLYVDPIIGGGTLMICDVDRPHWYYPK